MAKLMFVKNIDINEFRGIRRLSKPLELTNFTILIGRNNVGKTSILEALYLLTYPFTISLPPYNDSPINIVSKLHGGFSSLVYGYIGEASITYNLVSNIKLADMGLSGNDVRVVVRSNGSSEIWFAERSLDNATYQLVLNSLGCSLDRNLVALYIPNNTVYYDMLKGFALRDEVLRWIEKNGFHRKVVDEYISRAVYDRFTEVLKRGDRLCLRKEIDRGIGPLYIDVDSIGEGIKRFILTYFAIEYLNPKIVLWDDIEVAAHPSLLEIVIRWLSESGRQIVISTHSLDVLHILTLIMPKNARVIVLRKTRDDIVEWRSFEIDEIDEIVGKGIDIRKIVDELEI